MSGTRDAAMVAHAARRGTVWVHNVPATLIAWHPRLRDGRRRRGKARVDFGSHQRTVSVDDVTVLAVAE